MTRALSDTQILRELGRRTKDYRVALSLTQAELSAQTGVGLTTIHNFETGKAANISFRNLLALLRGLGLLDNAFKLIPEMPENPYSTLNNKQKRTDD